MLESSVRQSVPTVPARQGVVAAASGGWRGWLARHFQRHEERRIDPPERMWQRIRRERSLVARGRPPFSLLVFQVDDPERDPRPSRALIRVLRQRLRSSDAVGWLARGRVGVLLPATGRDGAFAVAADVDRLLAPDHATAPWILGARGSEGVPVLQVIPAAARSVSGIWGFPSRAAALAAFGPEGFVRAVLAAAGPSQSPEAAVAAPIRGEGATAAAADAESASSPDAPIEP